MLIKWGWRETFSFNLQIIVIRWIHQKYSSTSINYPQEPSEPTYEPIEALFYEPTHEPPRSYSRISLVRLRSNPMSTLLWAYAGVFLFFFGALSVGAGAFSGHWAPGDAAATLEPFFSTITHSLPRFKNLDGLPMKTVEPKIISSRFIIILFHLNIFLDQWSTRYFPNKSTVKSRIVHVTKMKSIYTFQYFWDIKQLV